MRIINYLEVGQIAREIRPRAMIMRPDPSLPRAQDEFYLYFSTFKMAPHVPERQNRVIPP